MKIVFLGSNKFFSFYKKELEAVGYELVGMDDSPDLGVIAYYGRIIKKKELEMPKRGFINIHPSLLPKYRGPSPVRSAILAGDKTTGVTIHITTSEVDAGDILFQEEFPIDPNDNYETLENKLFEEGAKILPDVIDKWISGEIIPKAQDHSWATFTKFAKTEDGKIDWTQDAEYILRQIKAFSPNPGAFAFLDGKRLLILDASQEVKNHDLEAGTVVRQESGFKIAAKNGFIVPLKVKLEGKKELSAEDFINGRQDIIGKAISEK